MQYYQKNNCIEYPYIIPNWPAPKCVKAFVSCRYNAMGNSLSPYQNFNLALHVGDDSHYVHQNRQVLAQQLQLPHSPLWLEQTHGINVINAKQYSAGISADGCYSTIPSQVCVVLTADCLPILLTNKAGNKVAVLHAGWRGLAKGIIEQGIAKLRAGNDGIAMMDKDEILVWLGPAISARAFEVGDNVKSIFERKLANAYTAFTNTHKTGHYWADIYTLAKLIFYRLGIRHIYGGHFCTYHEANRFYSYRRDKVTGRMASIIYIQKHTL